MAVSFTTKGYIEVWRDTRYVSRHRTETEAIESALADAAVNGPGEYTLRYPNKTVKAYGILASADTSAPTVPTDLVEDYHTASTASLSWTASTDNVGVTGYQVYRNGTPLGTTVTESYSDTGLTPSTPYTYTVAAYDAAGNNSGIAGQMPLTIITDSNVAPLWGVVQQELTTSVGYGLILTDVCSDADGNPLTFTQVSGNLPAGLSFSAISKAITGIPTTVETTSVVFRASDGITTTDATITFRVLNADTTAPSTPTLTATTAGMSQVDLSWTAATDPDVANARTSGISGYKVYRDGSLRTTLGNVTSYSDTNLAASTTYSYTVAAFDVSDNLGSQSAASEATTAAAFDFYVSVNGTGAVNAPGGSLADPWPITMLANATAQNRYKGCRVGIMDGTYNLYDYVGVFTNGWETAYINLPAGLSVDRPTVIQAVNARMAILEVRGPGDTYKPLLVGVRKSAQAIMGALGSGRNNIQVRDLVFRHHSGAVLRFGYTMSAGHNLMTKISNIVVEGCEIYDTNGYRPPVSIENVTNNGSGKCRITATAHGFTNSDTKIHVSGVEGVTAVNGTWGLPLFGNNATVVDANTIDVTSAAFSGVYTPGTGIMYIAYGENHAGMMIVHIQNLTVRDNYFHDNRAEYPAQTDHCQDVEYWDTIDSLIEFNTHKNTYKAFSFKGQNVTNWGNTIRYNFFGAGCGTDFNPAPNGEISYIYNNVWAGGGIGWDVQPFKQHEIRVFNNTFDMDAYVVNGVYSPKRAGPALLQNQNTTDYVKFWNNIVTGVRTIAGQDPAYVAGFTNDAWALLDYNCYWKMDGQIRMRTFLVNDYYNGSAFVGLEAWKIRVQSSLANAEAGSKELEPVFVRTGTDADYYKLAQGSPCIGTGRSDGTRDGVPCDMGAWGNGAPPKLGARWL